MLKLYVNKSGSSINSLLISDGENLVNGKISGCKIT